MEQGEFSFIEGLKSRFSVPSGMMGIGDDCAIIPQCSSDDTLVTADMLVEGSHFLLDDITPYQLGWKSVAVNLSDIAGMGGKPVGTFLSLAIPYSMESAWMEKFMDGYQAISDRFGVPLLGGDTTASPDRLCINVTVMGSCPHGSARKRSDAKPRDLVCVSGFLGDSSCGLKVILDKLDRTSDANILIDRHYLPMPRVAEGLRLSRLEGVHAMMDISDGIGSDLRHILEASGVGATIDTSALPLSSELLSCCRDNGLDPLDFALSGGEDYELLFTMAPGTVPDIPYYVIGEITPGSSIIWKGSDKDYHGFTHF